MKFAKGRAAVGVQGLGLLQIDIVLAKDRAGGEFERGDGFAQVGFGAAFLAARGDHGGLPLLHQEKRRGAGAELALLAVVLFFGGFALHARGVQAQLGRLHRLHALRTSASIVCSTCSR